MLTHTLVRSICGCGVCKGTGKLRRTGISLVVETCSLPAWCFHERIRVLPWHKNQNQCLTWLELLGENPEFGVIVPQQTRLRIWL